MFDKEEVYEVLELIYEYNLPPTISDIKNELLMDEIKVQMILNLLYEYDIIDEFNKPIKNYNKALLIIDKINF